MQSLNYLLTDIEYLTYPGNIRNHNKSDLNTAGFYRNYLLNQYLTELKEYLLFHSIEF